MDVRGYFSILRLRSDIQMVTNAWLQRAACGFD